MIHFNLFYKIPLKILLIMQVKVWNMIHPNKGNDTQLSNPYLLIFPF